MQPVVNMFRDIVNTHCRNLPGAEHTDHWGGGHETWKVGGKMFASTGVKSEGITFKCADPGDAEMLIDLGRIEKAPYLTRGGWEFVRWGIMDADELRKRLSSAYLTVRRSLTKNVQTLLGPEPG
jgi:predicted DNA-binding protein (MmcQ/YjbR family)